jgi:hypothetical protein
MKFTTPIEVSGIHQIVINRLVIWTRVEGIYKEPLWRKIDGGPGYKQRTITPEQMKRIVDKLLNKQITTGHWHGHEVVNELYRAWVHEDTLNITQRKRGAS